MGSLLKKGHAHYRAVTCLVFSDDQSLLISVAKDGSVKSLVSSHVHTYTFARDFMIFLTGTITDLELNAN